MPNIYLLTAPFDEKANTGDGQYALSLEKSFKENYKQIKCKWLKKENGDYNIPSVKGAKPIDEGTIPSVSVLQQVSNNKTVLSGYKLDESEPTKEVLDVIKKTVSPRTPKILLDKNGQLKTLAIMDVVSETGTILEKVNVQEIINKVKQKKEDLKKIVEENQKNEKIFKKNGKEIIGKNNNGLKILIETYKEQTKIHKNITLCEYIHAHVNMNKFIKKCDKTIEDLGALDNLFGKELDSKNKDKLEKTVRKLADKEPYDFQTNSLAYVMDFQEQPKELKTFFSYLSKTRQWTIPEQVNPVPKKKRKDHRKSKHVQIKDNASNKQKIKLVGENKDLFERGTCFKISEKRGFNLAFKANKQDPTKGKVIEDIIKSMGKINPPETFLDIHIRPPDCGVFITPGDIKKIKKCGIKVNITVHEYKQNYTRRHLQQYTHELMIEADSVQFFNDRDRNNAIRASKLGDCERLNVDENRKKNELDEDKWHKLEKFPIQTYGLEKKSGLTVASQQLSSEPDKPIEVINKPPNILSFGTIRPGKGFEEALEIAQLINDDVSGKNELRDNKKRIDLKQNIQTIPIVKLAGDPQHKDLMLKIYKERYGNTAHIDVKKRYEEKPDKTNEEKREFWINEFKRTDNVKNRYLEVYPWVTEDELDNLKKQSKYVSRMDDMGMRNNGSAIISVLDVGVVYTKFGSTTDDMYVQKNKQGKEGKYFGAVDLGKTRYGKFSPYRFFDKNKKERILRKVVPDDYKRKEGSRTGREILTSIVNREKDQRKCHSENNVKSSQNYQTVEKSQRLLKDHFSLKKSSDHLLKNIGKEDLVKKTALELTDDLLDYLEGYYRGQSSSN